MSGFQEYLEIILMRCGKIKEHIGVVIYKILNEFGKFGIQQKILIRKLEDSGYARNKSYMFVRYILTAPILISEDEWSEPLLIREAFMGTNKIMIKLGKRWKGTDVESVKDLFDYVNFDEY